MQTVSGHKVELGKTPTGLRVARIDGRHVVPMALLGLGAGRDAWMREVVIKCADCKQPNPASAYDNEAFCCEDCINKDFESGENS